MQIDEERIEQIKALPEPDRSRIIALMKASSESWQQVNAAYSASALKDAQAADAALESMLARVFPDETAPQQGLASERFKSRKEALLWLAEQGAQVSQGKFYQDCKAGKVLVFPDKTVSRASVAQYLLAMRRSNPVFDPAAADLSIREQELKVRKLELEVARLEKAGREEDTRWMLREDCWALLVGVLHTLRQNLDYYCNQAAAPMLLACEGRTSLAPQMSDLIMTQVVNPAYNDLAGQTLEHACFHGESKENREEEEDHGGTETATTG